MSSETQEPTRKPPVWLQGIAVALLMAAVIFVFTYQHPASGGILAQADRTQEQVQAAADDYDHMEVREFLGASGDGATLFIFHYVNYGWVESLGVKGEEAAFLEQLDAEVLQR